MCGRYVLVDGQKVFMTFEQIRDAKAAGIKIEELPPRYNISPQQTAPVVAIRNDELIVESMKWGLVPHWSKDGKIQFNTINAKSETLDQSKLYAPYFKSSRCLVPATGFYEWKEITNASGFKEKQPMYISMKDGKPFLMAGLFSVWKDEKGNEHPTYTIVTTTPNELVADIHNRMPVIIPEEKIKEWLDRNNKDVESLKKLLVPYPAGKMQAVPVSKMVNNPRNDNPDLVKPITFSDLPPAEKMEAQVPTKKRKPSTRGKRK